MNKYDGDMIDMERDSAYEVFRSRRREGLIEKIASLKKEMIEQGWSDSPQTEAEAMFKAMKENGCGMSEKEVWDFAWSAAAN